MDWGPLILTFKLAFITTVVLFAIAVPVAYWLAYSKSRIRPVIETLVSMPLVLPPTVVGFYLLLAFSPGNFFGNWLEEWLGIRLIFSFGGLLIASIIYSFPFMVQPIQSGFSSLPVSLKEASGVLGKSRWTTLSRILLPNIQPAILTGCILSFAHTVGEFGVVLMIGGNIPGKTKVASIAIYDEVEALNYPAANAYSLVIILIAFSLLLTVYFIKGRHYKNLFP